MTKDLDYSKKLVFHGLYSRHAEEILSYGLNRSSSDDASDMLAETFLIAWRKFDDIPNGIEAKYWLYGVARRVLHGQRRKATASNHLTNKLRQSLTRNSLDSFEETTAEQFCMEQILHSLPELDQEIIKLSFWENLTSIEIGKVLDMPPATIRTRLARAKAKLKTEIQEVGQGLKQNPEFLHLKNNGSKSHQENRHE